MGPPRVWALNTFLWLTDYLICRLASLVCIHWLRFGAMCEMELNDSFSSSSSDLNFMENSLLGLVVHCQTEPELQI